MKYVEERKITFDNREPNDWTITRLTDEELKIMESIDDLKEGDHFIVQNSFGVCPIPNIDISTTCFKAVSVTHFALDLPAGTLELHTITKTRRWSWGGIT